MVLPCYQIVALSFLRTLFHVHVSERFLSITDSSSHRILDEVLSELGFTSVEISLSLSGVVFHWHFFWITLEILTLFNSVSHTLLSENPLLCGRSFRWLRLFQTCVLVEKFPLVMVQYRICLWSADNPVEVLKENLSLLGGPTNSYWYRKTL